MMQSFKLVLQDFRTWWIAGLRAGLSAKSKTRDIRHQALTIKPLGEGFEYEIWDASKQALTWVRQVNSSTGNRGLGELKAKLPNGARTVLMLDVDKALVRAITLPLSARGSLSEVLGFEIDKLTPFRAESVSFSWTRPVINKNKQTISLLLVVTPKLTLEKLHNQLAAVGIKPDVVTVTDPRCRDSINLLPKSKRRVRAGMILPGLALITLLSALYLPLFVYQQQLNAQEQELAQLRQQAKALKVKHAQSLQQAELKTFLLAQQRWHHWLEIFNTLSEILPEHSWVERLQVNQQKLDIQGQSSAAASLIEILERNTRFHKVRFEAPVTHDQRSGKQRFHITLELEQRS